MEAKSLAAEEVAMRFEHVDCGDKKYVLQVFSDCDVLIRRDDAGSPGWGTKIGSFHSIEDALRFIRMEAGARKTVVRCQRDRQTK